MTTLTIFSTMMIMGLTCSLGCGTVATPFILGSLLGEGKDIAESRRGILIFSLGKVMTYALFGLAASLFGAVILGFVEELYPNATIWLVRGVTFFLGAKIIASSLSEKKEKVEESVEEPVETKMEVISSCGGCPSQTVTTACCPSGGCPSQQTTEISPAPETASSGCSGCGSGGGCTTSPKAEQSKVLAHKGSFFWAGALMASIPCGPLLTALTFASTMDVFTGTLLLFCFGVANSIFPVLFYASLVGLANREFHRDAPTMVRHTKHMGGAILMYAAIFMV